MYNMKPLNPKTTCADGTTVSVQASALHYSLPRDDEGPYTHVEVGFPTERPDWWGDYAEDPDTLETVAGYVPIALVEQFIEQHGGAVGRVSD